MIAQLRRRLVRDERGVALVLALITMMVLGITTAALVLPGAVDQRNSYDSASARQAFELAQAALSYGEGAVYAAGQSGVAPPTTQQTIPQQAGGGTGKWTATEINDGCNCTWSITGVGSIHGQSRTVSAIATDPSSQTVTDNTVWNYLYSDSTSVCTTISGGVTVSVPILTRGNVCVSGGGHFIGSQLKVGGTLSDVGGSNIGTSASPVGVVQIGGCTAWTNGSCSTTTTNSCTVQPSTVQTVAPGTSPCDGKHSPLYASSIGGTLNVTPEMPCIGQPSSLDPLCTGANNGTWTTLKSQYSAQASMSKSGCPSNLLDSDSTLNNSLSATTLTGVMFGTTAYDCKVGSNEIKWTPSGSCNTGTLYVSGTIYFDGSLNLKCGLKVTYTGQATLYFTGTVIQAGGTQLCGISGCTASWNPNTNGIIFIAGCWGDSTGTTGNLQAPCVEVTGGSTAQWGSYATTQYLVAGGSSNMGPALANSLNIGGGASSLVPFTVMPPGTPLNSVTESVPASAPKEWSG